MLSVNADRYWVTPIPEASISIFLIFVYVREDSSLYRFLKAIQMRPTYFRSKKAVSETTGPGN